MNPMVTPWTDYIPFRLLETSGTRWSIIRWFTRLAPVYTVISFSGREQRKRVVSVKICNWLGNGINVKLYSTLFLYLSHYFHHFGESGPHFHKGFPQYSRVVGTFLQRQVQKTFRALCLPPTVCELSDTLQRISIKILKSEVKGELWFGSGNGQFCLGVSAHAGWGSHRYKLPLVSPPKWLVFTHETRQWV